MGYLKISVVLDSQKCGNKNDFEVNDAILDSMPLCSIQHEQLYMAILSRPIPDDDKPGREVEIIEGRGI